MVQEATYLIQHLPYGILLTRKWSWGNVHFLSKGFVEQKSDSCGWIVMFVERYSRIWGQNDRLWLNREGPSIPTGLWTILGSNREPLRVLKQGRHFIRVALLNINLMVCAGQIQSGRSWRQLWNSRRGSKCLISDQRNKQTAPGNMP